MSKSKKTNAQRTGETPALNVQDGAQDGTPASKPKKARKSGGDRPSTFTPDIGAEICAAIANGATLTALCAKPGYPDRTTVWRWMQAFPDFEDEYLRARVFSQQMHGDEAIDIARNEEDIARARVMIDARRLSVTRLSSQYAGLIAARTPEAQPISVADAINETRRKLDALVEEVGWERAERIREDECIAKATNPNPNWPEALIRAQQRAAIHALEKRKQKLLDATPANKDAI